MEVIPTKLPEIVFALLLGMGTAYPQQPPRLSVQEALDLADKQNLDLATAWRRRAVTLAGIRIARQRPTQLASVAENGEYVQRV